MTLRQHGNNCRPTCEGPKTSRIVKTILDSVAFGSHSDADPPIIPGPTATVMLR
jgi:hypothetical protein